MRNSTGGWRRIVATALSATLLISVVSPCVVASAAAGEEGYVSLHQYISPTEEENVFRVTMSLKGDPGKIPETEIAIVIDNSQSMNSIGTENTLTNFPGFINEYDVLSTYSDISGFFTPPTYGWDKDLTPLIYDRAINQNGGTAIDYQKSCSIALGTAQVPKTATTPAYWSDSAGSYRPPTTIDQWIHPLTFTAAGLTNDQLDTRLKAALTGAQEAIDLFLDPSRSLAADVTSVGVITFNDETDASTLVSNFPFAAMGGTNDVFSYGYGYAGIAVSDAAVPPSLTKPYAKAITYSSRMFDEVSLGATVPNFGLGFYKTAPQPASQSYAALLTRPLPQLITAKLGDTDYQTSGSKEEFGGKYLRGLVPYEAGSNTAQTLRKSLENVFAPTDWAQTSIYSGLYEASMMLGVNAVDSTIPALITPSPVASATDGKRRIVILLTDGEDSISSSQAVMKLVSKMKNAGVEFYAMGINTVGTSAAVGKTNADGKGYSTVTGKEYWPGSIYASTNGYSGSANATLIPLATPDNYEYEQMMVFMATNYDVQTTSFTSGYGTWANVEADYLGNGPEWTGQNPNYYYVGGADMTAQIKEQFAEIAKKIGQFGEEARVNIKLNQNFELYKFPGEPLLKTGGNVANQTATRTGNSIDWYFGGDGVPVMNEATLTFFIKIDPTGLSSDAFYAPFSSTFSAYGPFPEEGKTKPKYGWNSHQASLAFSSIYVSPSGETQGGSGTGSDSTSGSAMDKSGTNSTSFTSSYGGSDQQPQGLIPISGSGSGTVYTPSVTPVQNVIENESLQEKTDSVEVPVTGEKSVGVQVLLLIGIVASALMIIPKVKTKKKTEI